LIDLLCIVATEG